MNKRTLYFMLTALVAIGCVALYTWFSEKSSSSPISKSTAEASSVQETIEAAISNIEITGYYNQGDITKDLKDTYLETLKDNYSQRSAFIVAQILQKEPIDKNEVKKYISHWATIKTNDPSVNEVKKDWQWYVFYTSILPKHLGISYAVFCLKKKNIPPIHDHPTQTNRQLYPYSNSTVFKRRVR